MGPLNFTGGNASPRAALTERRPVRARDKALNYLEKGGAQGLRPGSIYGPRRHPRVYT